MSSGLAKGTKECLYAFREPVRLPTKHSACAVQHALQQRFKVHRSGQNDESCKQ
jgi:hypothetical protein